MSELSERDQQEAEKPADIMGRLAQELDGLVKLDKQRQQIAAFFEGIQKNYSKTRVGRTVILLVNAYRAALRIPGRFSEAKRIYNEQITALWNDIDKGDKWKNAVEEAVKALSGVQPPDNIEENRHLLAVLNEFIQGKKTKAEVIQELNKISDRLPKIIEVIAIFQSEEQDFLSQSIKTISDWIKKYNEDPNVLLWFARIVYEKNKIISARYKKELVLKIESDSAIKMLLRYPEEIRILRNWQFKVDQSFREQDWKNFEEFYTRLNEELHQLVNIAGDKDTAKKIHDFAGKKHEDINAWKMEFEELLRNLHSPEKRQRIVNDAVQSMDGILNKRIDEIKERQKKEIKSIADGLEEILARYGSQINDLKKAIAELAKTYKKSVSAVKMGFDKIHGEAVVMLDNLNNKIREMITKMNPSGYKKTIEGTTKGILQISEGIMPLIPKLQNEYPSAQEYGLFSRILTGNAGLENISAQMENAVKDMSEEIGEASATAEILLTAIKELKDKYAEISRFFVRQKQLIGFDVNTTGGAASQEEMRKAA